MFAREAHAFPVYSLEDPLRMPIHLVVVEKARLRMGWRKDCCHLESRKHSRGVAADAHPLQANLSGLVKSALLHAPFSVDLVVRENL